MNLHAIAGPIIAAINPALTIPLYRSTGYTVDSHGHRIPTYEALSGLAQIQPVGSGEIQHLYSLNIQGELRSVYLYGNWSGIVRIGQEGGDMVIIEDRVWLVVNSAENWPEWSRVIVQLQTDITVDGLLAGVP